MTVAFTAQKIEFSIKDFFSKCDQIHRKLRIRSQLLKKSLMENFIFMQCLLLRSQGNWADIIYIPARPATPGRVGGGMAPPLFCIAKRKQENKGEKRNNFRGETIKRLSQRSKCYCFSHSRAFKIQKFFYSANHCGRKKILSSVPWPLHFEIHLAGPGLFSRTCSQTLIYFGFGYKLCIILLGKCFL